MTAVKEKKRLRRKHTRIHKLKFTYTRTDRHTQR